jgi:hypothetical protein
VVIHPERKTSLTAAISASVIDGRENGRNSFLIIYSPFAQNNQDCLLKICQILNKFSTIVKGLRNRNQPLLTKNFWVLIA